MVKTNTLDFPPERQRGFSLHATLIGALGLISLVAAWLATNEPIGLRFTLYILGAGIAFVPLPILAYQLYSLQRGNYQLDRDKLTITWGLRAEKIPVSDIEWVRPIASLEAAPLLPLLHLPGSILGQRRVAGMGVVEYIAAEVNALLFIATRNRIVAISPADGAGFVQNLQSAMEMGSLSPEAPESVYPSFILGEAWKSRLARYFWLLTILLNVGLLTWVSLLAPDLGSIPLGFLPSGEPGELVPGVGLILLPAVSIFLSVLGWIVGLVFYRRSEQQLVSHLLWISCALMTILFLVAVLYIVSAV